MTAAALAVVGLPRSLYASGVVARRMKISLSCGSIGVSANQPAAIALAAHHGFEAVEPDGGYLARLGEAELEKTLATLREHKLVWGCAGLPLDFRGDEERFQTGLKDLPRIMKVLAQAGAKRVGTWLSPAHNSLTFLQNFRQHARRLRGAAKILADHGQRLGLEYVGTPSARVNRRFPFVHSLVETQELIDEIGQPNVGLVLDSWHWWTAGETAADLRRLKAEQVVAADLNDAPAGIPLDKQRDNERELPAATGVIPVASFLEALHQIGFDGPVRAEPFNRKLEALDNEAACAATVAAMKQAFALAKWE